MSRIERHLGARPRREAAAANRTAKEIAEDVARNRAITARIIEETEQNKALDLEGEVSSRNR